jgi:hypothetical protein
MTQKFQRGDLVHVAKDLGSMMWHFAADIDAIVIGSYKDQYGGSSEQNEREYTLFLQGRGRSSWYYENQLELIEAHRLDLLEQWQAEKDAEIKQASDRDWIFAQEYQEGKLPHGATLATLAADLGCTNLWGSRGEGVTWMQNAMITFGHAWPYLKAKDQAGWQTYSAAIRAKQVP